MKQRQNTGYIAARMLIALALLLTAVRCSDDGGPATPDGGVRIELVAPPEAGTQYAEFDFINESAGDVHFPGYGDTAPLYSVQVQRDGQWHDRFLGWCGTGLERQTLRPGTVRRFSAWCDTAQADWRVGVGLLDAAGETRETVWSGRVPGS